MSGVETHRLQRSIRALTVGTAIGLEKRRRKLFPDQLAEYDQQFQLPIRGRASDEMVWVERTVKFETVFFNATEQRDSPYAVPHFTYGAVIESGPPVIVAACVRKWDIDRRDAILGCDLAVGAFNPGGESRFSGYLHATFQGYGYPDEESPDDFPTP